MRTVLILILRAAGNSGNVCLSARRLRNHGLITDWRNLGVRCSCMETIVVCVLSGFCFLPCQGSALTN